MLTHRVCRHISTPGVEDIMKITFIGHGYVGLVSAAVFADFGNTVYVIGHTKEKIENLKKGIIPIFEPGLEELVKKNVEAGRLIFTMDYDPAVGDSDIVFTAVGTPPLPTGDADLSTVLEVVEKIGKNLKGYTVIATKSTVPVGTYKKIHEIVDKVRPAKTEFDLASVPEFLREGTAIEDTTNPDRIVIGTISDKARKLLLSLHEPIKGARVLTNLPTAEMIKYASNSFLATKISYANAIAKLSELMDADGLKVIEGMGLDSRIGEKFLSPGAGYGGSCFPKDVQALIAIAREQGYDFGLLREAERVNAEARLEIVKKAEKMLGDVDGKTIGVLGLAFKPNTDDMRDAPSIDIIHELVKRGAKVKGYDPEAMKVAKSKIGGIEFVESAYAAVENAELMILLTEWNEFREMDLQKVSKLMKSHKIVDGRNVWEPDEMKKLGFEYVGVGR